ncbi:spinster family MFS transporter [Sphingomonas immobilis]|uniref:MFS transporter n=1 Tax=Sphingomonas immobilis TaxID=3063997 RepID=A0ABT8ZX11_9SPHN|nr:MFS transporter [Sphingomonas sp. CA1-15]MDO7842114.1 MFS transporter [Sphingomonas sp. CA1-15]
MESNESDTSRAHAFWTPRRRHYVLFILCLVGIFNFIDRQILAILLEPIKEDLKVTDTAMGLLSGVAFAAFYVTAGFPLARIADRGNRRTLIAICLAVWSVATAACGIVTSYVQLIIARMGVAGGEAGAYPASQSIIADLYPVSQRGTVIGILLAAQSIGIAFGLFFGGWLNHAFDWRTAFIVVGLPGLLLAIVVILTVTEPPRGMADGTPQAVGDTPSAAEVARFIFGTPAMLLLLVVAICNAFTGYSLLAWTPAFFMRVHGMNTLEVGKWMGLVIASGLFVGNIFAGRLSDTVAKGNLSTYMIVSGCFALVSIPFGAWFALAPSTSHSLAGLFIGHLLMTGWLPPVYAVAIGLAPPRMRAMVIAVVGFCMTLMGIGLGPLAVGAVNDALKPAFGQEAVRYSLLFIHSGLLFGGLAAFVTAWLLRKRATAIAAAI